MKKLLCILITLLAAGSASAAEKNYCGDLRNAFGPFDYRNRASLPDQLNIVEHSHFTEDVEAGISGASGKIGDDLSYTLRAWPNHHRALATLSAVGLRTKSVMLPDGKYPVDCWFNRALRFAPDDGTLHAVYANHLYAHGKAEAAFAELRQAVALEPESPTINYNLGLAYFKNGDYGQALKYAQKAYGLNYPLPGLKKKLIDVGKWVEPARQATPDGDVRSTRPVEELPGRSDTAGNPTP